MRSSTFLSAAFAASVLAGPVDNVKRDYVTEITWVTVTEYVYAGQEPATPAPAAPPAYTHQHHQRPSSKAPEPAPPAASDPAPQPPVYSSPAPPPPPPPASSEAPPPPAYTPPPAPASSSAAPPPPPPASSSAPETGSGNTVTLDSPYNDIVLAHHNVHRANHSAPDLSWNETLANAAKVLGSRCEFAHDTTIGGGGYGQNLAASAPNANVSGQITESWYNGEMSKFEPYYGAATPQVDEETFKAYGHFTQLVWADTQSVGCATVDCMGTALGMHITVCNYYPPGNFAGKWDKNVIRPRGDKTCNYNDKIAV